MKTFKDLQVGDKIYIGFYAKFVQYIEYVEGYLHIHYFLKEKNLSMHILMLSSFLLIT